MSLAPYRGLHMGGSGIEVVVGISLEAQSAVQAHDSWFGPCFPGDVATGTNDGAGHKAAQSPLGDNSHLFRSPIVTSSFSTQFPVQALV